MNKDISTNTAEEPATVEGPAPYEEELKDYSKTSESDLKKNMPASHPEPTPDE